MIAARSARTTTAAASGWSFVSADRAVEQAPRATTETAAVRRHICEIIPPSHR